MPGFSFLPKMQYWGHEGDCDTIKRLVLGPDDHGRGGRFETHCANCNSEASSGTKFKQCVRCKAAWCKYLPSFCMWLNYSKLSLTTIFTRLLKGLPGKQVCVYVIVAHPLMMTWNVNFHFEL